MLTLVYIKLDAPEQLLVSEGVCRQLKIFAYHPNVISQESNPPIGSTGSDSNLTSHSSDTSYTAATDPTCSNHAIEVDQECKLKAQNGGIDKPEDIKPAGATNQEVHDDHSRFQLSERPLPGSELQGLT